MGIDLGEISRRDTLKLLVAMGGAASAASLWPIKAVAQQSTAPSLASPPPSTPVAAGSDLVTAYVDSLTSVPGNPYVAMPDTLYALTAESRLNVPFNGISLSVPAYTDPANNSQISQPLVGPTMTFVRGQTTGVWLQNSLTVCGPVDNMMMTDPLSEYTPHGYTTTNLHTHGLHVSPKAPSDDVLLMIGSTEDTASTSDRTDFPYYYDLPSDHPVGTFWYHPHKHGSVASQVGPGMSGALIVRSGPGQTDFDELLAAAPYNITEDDEEILVLQTIDYDYTNADKTAGAFFPVGYYTGTTNLGGASCYGASSVTSGPSSAATSVNGVVNPTLTMNAGEIRRLRIVNATNGQTYVPMFSGSGTLPGVYVIATDGIALPPPFSMAGFSDTDPHFAVDYSLTASADPAKYWTTAELITLAPGQRVDLLINPTEAGTFTLAGAAKGAAPMVVEHNTPNTATLLTLQVNAETPSKSQQLPPLSLFKSDQIDRPEPPAQVLSGPGMPVATQTLEFKTLGAAFVDGVPTEPAFLINDQHFNAGQNSAQLQLYKGDSDVWNLYSTNDAHIFHIHINSFIAFARIPYDTPNRVYGNPIFYLLPIWRDTIYFDAGTDGEDFVPGTMVAMASKQVEFTGEFVLHCHNLFHEDNGMMLTVAILDPETGAYDPGMGMDMSTRTHIHNDPSIPDRPAAITRPSN
ncbi:MAG: multicopper oxidase family protein [Alphaproteobacteria bacterium]|nr:multicopper oxidase family protein [Alphaproteobacteria bacterium]